MPVINIDHIENIEENTFLFNYGFLQMVPFAGYSMPVEYAGLSISASHVHTRNHVSVFDVSHMLQSKLHGNERVDFIESLVVADVKASVVPGHSTYIC